MLFRSIRVCRQEVTGQEQEVPCPGEGGLRSQPALTLTLTARMSIQVSEVMLVVNGEIWHNMESRGFLIQGQNAVIKHITLTYYLNDIDKSRFPDC